jgi:hypothetical protein
MTPLPIGAAVSTALRLLDQVPSDLALALDMGARFQDDPPCTVTELIEVIRDSPADDATRLELHQAFVRWDALDDPEWAARTRHQTTARRDRIYGCLRLTPDDAAAFDQLFPAHVIEDPGFEISSQHVPWFDQVKQEKLGFYWPRYENLLRTVENWPEESVASLSRATKQVVERLGDPQSPSAHAARGLVVGYVQSGKTANFTGVIARAVDAGYRLIIVLTGMTRILREQTQRRLDRQLIGRELLKGVATGEFEYEHAPDWDKFIAYGGRPSEQLSVDWRRLTTLAQDYRRLGTGISALHFERVDPSEPANSPANLRAAPARLVVAMKHRTPLDALLKDLRQVARAGFNISEIPTLIIDDESDQASVNTKRPTRGDVRARTAINKRIVELLDSLPRAQYVGYTATPFANVFVDPNDKLGIFPKDFIIGLERPHGYMGASDYHDFGPPAPGLPRNEKVHVRSVTGGDLADDNLRKALDSYFLSGAIKLFRAADPHTEIATRHHTMLVHTSHRVPDHKLMREQLLELIETGGYDTGSAFSRLSDLLRDDFRRYSRVRAPGLPFPASLEMLLPYLEQCWDRVVDTGPGPALIVNGEKEFENETPDFDRESVWKIVVGGTKLSRGYTVEGLTVSYYRRTARAADTLMQMGRWFGFRQNYQDLMRLFIGRAEPIGRRTIDLYAAFGAICQDELDFREELLQYAIPEDGSPPLRPMDVAPLVIQRFPDIRPTAPNRMFNAQQVSANFGGRPINPTLATTKESERSRNEHAARELFAPCALEEVRIGALQTFRALHANVATDRLIEFLKEYRFSKANLLSRQLAFLEGQLGDPEIDRWAALWPQLEQSDRTWSLTDAHDVTIIRRHRFESGRFNVYTGSDHVAAAKLVNGVESDPGASEDTRRIAVPKTGTALFYAVIGESDTRPTIGFALYPPVNSIKNKTVWAVVDPTAGDAPIVARQA